MISRSLVPTRSVLTEWVTACTTIWRRSISHLRRCICTRCICTDALGVAADSDCSSQDSFLLIWEFKWANFLTGSTASFNILGSRWWWGCVLWSGLTPSGRPSWRHCGTYGWRECRMTPAAPSCTPVTPLLRASSIRRIRVGFTVSSDLVVVVVVLVAAATTPVIIVILPPLTSSTPWILGGTPLVALRVISPLTSSTPWILVGKGSRHS